jgi:hypothetical protein
MLPAKHAYLNKKKDYESIEIQVNDLIATLDDIQKIIQKVSQMNKDILNTLKKAILRVTKIIVKASNRAFVDDKPLIFEIQAEWLDIQGTFHVEWAANQDISVLYSQALHFPSSPSNASVPSLLRVIRLMRLDKRRYNDYSEYCYFTWNVCCYLQRQAIPFPP